MAGRPRTSALTQAICLEMHGDHQPLSLPTNCQNANPHLHMNPSVRQQGHNVALGALARPFDPRHIIYLNRVDRSLPDTHMQQH